MIGHLRGKLIDKQLPEIIVDVGGVGYEIAIPATNFYDLPQLGEEIALFIHFVVREDAQLLYGFMQRQERSLFRELIKTNGVGPKLALAILSGLSVAQFIQAIEQNDVSMLVKLPGVGKKTAERLIIEMRDRLKQVDHLTPFEFDSMSSKQPQIQNNGISAANAAQEAIAALVSLGYKPQDAARMVKKVNDPDASSELLIREALRAAL